MYQALSARQKKSQFWMPRLLDSWGGLWTIPGTIRTRPQKPRCLGSSKGPLKCKYRAAVAGIQPPWRRGDRVVVMGFVRFWWKRNRSSNGNGHLVRFSLQLLRSPCRVSAGVRAAPLHVPTPPAAHRGFRQLLAWAFEVPRWSTHSEKYRFEMPIHIQPPQSPQPRYVDAVALRDIPEGQHPTIVFLFGGHFTAVAALFSFIGDMQIGSDSEHLRLLAT
jgi:hypothetical protein